MTDTSLFVVVPPKHGDKRIFFVVLPPKPGDTRINFLTTDDKLYYVDILCPPPKSYDIVKQFHAGVADVQYDAGVALYDLSSGNKQQERVGMEVVRMAANQGHAEAQFFLGTCYAGHLNAEEAFKYVKLSADNLFPSARGQFALATVYNDTLHDTTKCYEYCMKALKNGYKPNGPDELSLYEKVMEKIAVVSVKPPIQRCDVCEDVCDPFFCSACGIAKYCSKSCQTVAWKKGGHKAKCNKRD